MDILGEITGQGGSGPRGGQFEHVKRRGSDALVRMCAMFALVDLRRGKGRPKKY